MASRTFSEILSLVDKPSRYLGQEINRVVKDINSVDLHIALAFPDLYEIGTSHFGLQILYNILNGEENIYAERVFAPATDMAQKLRDNNIPLLSLETRTPLRQFDIVGFSLLYELNYTNILYMMDLANIPFLSSKRDASHPIVIAGGPCTCNPEPLADFFDAMVIGDGEETLIKMSRAYLVWKEDKSGDKEALLKAWSKLEGVYIPSFFQASIDSAGFQTLAPKSSEYSKIRRTIVKDLDHAVFPDAPIIPHSKPIHDRLRIEVSRGCSRGCRFCQAGMIYRPVRERSVKNLSGLFETSMVNTGYEDLSLLSLSTGDYSGLVPLMENIMGCLSAHPTAISLPSLRAETLTPKLMNLIKKVRKTGFTIAPEAGSQRLRDVINKNISEKDIVDTVSDALAMGWQGVKLYFMIGLPTENDEDLQGIVDLVKKLLKIKGKNKKRYALKVSVATFIPKPHTPFQWASQISLEESRQKIAWLKDKLKSPGIHFKWQNPEVSILEGLWARGDRRLSRLLLAGYQKGCRFDGWSDQFRFDLWKEALLETDIDVNFFTTRKRHIHEPLPWNHIDINSTREFLEKEWEKAKSGDLTPDCRWGNCSDCGICDFKTVAPRIHHQVEGHDEKNSPASFSGNHIDPNEYRKLRLTYSKEKQAKYFGHLELVSIIHRAVRRAGIPVKYSEGYHPKPKISFKDSLPVGMESLNESLFLFVPKKIDTLSILNRLNANLPEGIFIKNCEAAPLKRTESKDRETHYMITLKDGIFSKKAVECFLSAESLLVTRITKKGKKKTINLKETVTHLKLLSPNRLKLTIRCDQERAVRPAEILQRVFCLEQKQIKMAGIVKL